MLTIPFTVTIGDAKLEIPASEKEVLDFLEAADILRTVDMIEFTSALEIPFYPHKIQIDYIEQSTDSIIPVTAEELNDMFYILTDWMSREALDAGLTYFGCERLMQHNESDFSFYPETELDDFGRVLIGELYEVPYELIDYIDYETYADDYLTGVEGAVTEYGTIILRD